MIELIDEDISCDSQHHWDCLTETWHPSYKNIHQGGKTPSLADHLCPKQLAPYSRQTMVGMRMGCRGALVFKTKRWQVSRRRPLKGRAFSVQECQNQKGPKLGWHLLVWHKQIHTPYTSLVLNIPLGKLCPWFHLWSPKAVSGPLHILLIETSKQFYLWNTRLKKILSSTLQMCWICIVSSK